MWNFSFCYFEFLVISIINDVKREGLVERVEDLDLKGMGLEFIFVINCVVEGKLLFLSLNFFKSKMEIISFNYRYLRS